MSRKPHWLRVAEFIAENPRCTAMDLIFKLFIRNVTGRISDARLKGWRIDCDESGDVPRYTASRAKSVPVGVPAGSSPPPVRAADRSSPALPALLRERPEAPPERLEVCRLMTDADDLWGLRDAADRENLIAVTPKRRGPFDPGGFESSRKPLDEIARRYNAHAELVRELRREIEGTS